MKKILIILLSLFILISCGETEVENKIDISGSTSLSEKEEEFEEDDKIINESIEEKNITIEQELKEQEKLKDEIEENFEEEDKILNELIEEENIKIEKEIEEMRKFMEQ